jgi:thiosulfate/3-mercaptopyruvate sulfurtransferase
MSGFPIIVLAVVLMDPGERQSSSLVSFDELQNRLDDSHLRLVDARPRPEYDKGHIPGAVWVDVKAVEKMAARPGGLTDRAGWESWIEPLGIGPDSRVLVYDAHRQLDAARLWWLLRYFGVEQVGLIDGGFPLWQKQGRPVSAEIPKVEPRAFPIRFRAGWLATRGDVLKALKEGKARVIDARSEAEHTGTVKRSKRGGHVPTACHLEWAQLVDAEGRFLDETTLRDQLARAGVKPGEPVITHCQGGGRASVDAFVFERLGFPNRNYYLGWSDWGNVDETPIETGPATKGGKN